MRLRKHPGTLSCEKRWRQNETTQQYRLQCDESLWTTNNTGYIVNHSKGKQQVYVDFKSICQFLAKGFPPSSAHYYHTKVRDELETFFRHASESVKFIPYSHGAAGQSFIRIFKIN